MGFYHDKKGINPKKQKRMSIQQQITILFSLCMLFVVLVCWIVNATSLEKFYLWNKEKAMHYAYESFNRAAKNDLLNTDDYDIEWQSICNKYNISAVILDTDSQTVICSSNDVGNMKHLLMDYFFGMGPEYEQSDRRIIKETKNYTVQIVKDSRMQSEFVETWGVLNNGNPFLLRSPLEGIEDSARISNHFLLYVGMVAVLFGIFIIRFFSGRISKPIWDLTNISEKMRELDFEVKYQGTGWETEEIDHLGNNINELSGVLKTTISELKTANNELQRDIDSKNKLDEMRRDFLSNVSHELKTPLALIQGYAEGLKEGITDDPENMDFYCEVIIDEASKMNVMVKKLLTLNELEFGNDTIQIERFDVVALIKNYIQSIDILLKQNNAEVLMEDYEPVYVWADEFKIEEVLMNFLSNALNHLENERKIRITIWKGEGKAKIAVFNTGQPIPEDSLPYIWEKFYKVDKARTREYGGSGVGLSIVKAIMNSMHQNFGVCNYQDGVEFWIELDTENKMHDEAGMVSND